MSPPRSWISLQVGQLPAASWLSIINYDKTFFIENMTIHYMIKIQISKKSSANLCFGFVSFLFLLFAKITPDINSRLIWCKSSILCCRTFYVHPIWIYHQSVTNRNFRDLFSDTAKWTSPERKFSFVIDLKVFHLFVISFHKICKSLITFYKSPKSKMLWLTLVIFLLEVTLLLNTK